MSHRIEVETGSPELKPADVLSSKVLDATLVMENLHHRKLGDTQNLQLMLRLYNRGELSIKYKKSDLKVEEGFKIKVTTVSLIHPADDVLRLNMHSRIWTEDPEKEARNILEGRDVDLAHTGFILQVNTVKDNITKFTQKTGVDFRKYPDRKPFPAHALLFETIKPERRSLGLEITTEELLTMQRIVLNLYQRPRFSPALQR